MTNSKLFTRPTQVQSVSTLKLMALFLSVFLCMPRLFATGGTDAPRIEVEALSTYSWSVTIHLPCTVGSGDYATISQFPGQPGFDGFSDATVLLTNDQTIVYTLTGPHSPLPSGADVALITVTGDSCGENHSYQVTTDGAGSMLVLDEL